MPRREWYLMRVEMPIRSVAAVYFSPTGTTRRVVSRIADAASRELCEGCPPAHHDLTSPRARSARTSFAEGELAVFGVPVYAGRVPALLEESLRALHGGGALAVAVVVYGNRHYDDALIELGDRLEAQRFRVVAAAAFVGEHSYSESVARGRPDDDDLALATELAARVSRKLSGGAPLETIVLPGCRPYRELSLTIDLSRAKPIVSAACQRCRQCVEVCPTGAIDPDDVAQIGECIRCNACIRACPSQARSFADGNYLLVKRWLEENCARRRTPELFV